MKRIKARVRRFISFTLTLVDDVKSSSRETTTVYNYQNSYAF